MTLLWSDFPSLFHYFQRSLQFRTWFQFAFLGIQMILEEIFRWGSLTLFLLRGAKSGPDDQIQSGIFTFWWLESPNFMTLFLFTFARSQRSHLLKKENQFLKNPKNWFGSFNIEGSPLWIKILKNQNFSLFWKKIILLYLNMN